MIGNNRGLSGNSVGNDRFYTSARYEAILGTRRLGASPLQGEEDGEGLELMVGGGNPLTSILSPCARGEAD